MLRSWKRSLAATAMAVGAITAPMAQVDARPAPHPAQGVYSAVDNVDGSNLLLAVWGGADRARVVLFDDEATVACPLRDSPALGRGRGTWVANDLDVSLRIRCLGEPNPGSFPITYVYDPATDTISSGGDTYTRL